MRSIVAFVRDEGVNGSGDVISGQDRMLCRKSMRLGGQDGDRGRAIKATRAPNFHLDG